MPAYNFVALDEKGKTRKGVIAADSLRDARKLLQARQLYPVSVQEGRAAAQGESGSFLAGLVPKRRQAISAADLALITRQMATMIGAGIAINDTLQSIAAQNMAAINRDVLTNVRSRLVEGARLSEALQSEPASFDRLYIAMIAAGEASGDLAGILDRVAEYAEKSENVKNKVRAALIYPAVLSVVALGVLTLLITMVVPKIANQFQNFDSALPLATQIVVGASDMLVRFGPLILAGLMILGLAFRRALRNTTFRLSVDTRLLALPIIGRFTRMVASARFARTLGTLLDGGSPVLDALKAARETQGNHLLRKAIDDAYVEVFEGGSLSAAFRRVEVFSPLLVYMMAMGEKSGSLPMLLLKSAEYLEQEIDGWTQSFLSLLEPVIVVIMGLVVGFIVMSIMLPIMQLNSLILN
ncbi:MAG: type II secretion system inner membrane protein GspF [Parvibaculales bacterium]